MGKLRRILGEHNVELMCVLIVLICGGSCIYYKHVWDTVWGPNLYAEQIRGYEEIMSLLKNVKTVQATTVQSGDVIIELETWDFTQTVYSKNLTVYITGNPEKQGTWVVPPLFTLHSIEEAEGGELLEYRVTFIFAGDRGWQYND